MTIVQRLLTTLILLELTAFAVAVGWRVSRPVPPPADVSRMDDDARSSLEALRSRTWNGSTASWSRLGHAYLGSGLFLHAEACYRRVLLDDPRDITCRYGLALCLSRTGRTGEAIEQFREFVGVAGPRHADPAWYQIGRCYLREENADEAELAFKHVNQLPEAIIQWAQLLVRTGRAEEVQPVIEGLLTQYPNSLHVLDVARRCALERNRQRDAARYAERLESATYMFAMSLDVSDIENYRPLAGLAGSGSGSNRAPQGHAPEDTFDRLSRRLTDSRDGRDRRLLLPTAQAALQDGHPRTAMELLDRLFEQYQVTPQALNTYGDAQLALQQPAAAVRTWQHSFRLLPTADACQRLAEQGTEFIDAAQRREYSTLARHLAGVREFRAHRADAAVAELQSAVELQPEHAPSWLYLGKALLLLHRTGEAKEAFQTCLELDPDNSDAQAAAAMLSNGDN